MGRGRIKVSDPASRSWETAGGRVRWLLHDRWKGNCSAMAEAIGVSHTVINRIDIAGREPGRRVLEAVAAHPKISPAWVLSGQGEPFVEPPPTGGKRVVVPVAKSVLPGPLIQHSDLLTDETIDTANFFTASQYWLCLKPGDSILDHPLEIFHHRDRLLIETDRRAFPAEDRLSRHLCVVKNRSGADPPYLLGEVDYYEGGWDAGPAHLLLDIFDGFLPKNQTVEQVVVNVYPDGEMTCHKQILQLDPSRRGKRGVKRHVYAVPMARKISYADVVGVWTGLLYRLPNS